MVVELLINPEEAAEAAHLHYVNDDGPGYSRKRSGRGFAYYDTEGELIREAAERKRLDALVIPPAWSHVWICPEPEGHILATGRDEKGRKQYIYHPRWAEIRNETKFNKMLLFGQALPNIRQQVDRDLRLHGLPRERVLALMVRLLDKTLIRVGNVEYARSNHSFGLTTLQTDHLAVNGSTLYFEFLGKSKKWHQIELKDRRAARVIRQCQELPGQELFQYLDEAGQRRSVASNDINNYLHQITSEEFSAKDFRTWGGTVCVLQTLREIGPAENKTETKKNITQAIKKAAQQLGNTTTVCRNYYVHPAVLEAYQDGSLFELLEASGAAVAADSWLEADEQALLALLQEWIERRAARSEEREERSVERTA
jgi:DNA topoisomerase-1